MPSFLDVRVLELRLVDSRDQLVELAAENERHLIVPIVTGVSVSAPTSKSGLLYSSPNAWASRISTSAVEMVACGWTGGLIRRPQASAPELGVALFARRFLYSDPFPQDQATGLGKQANAMILS